LAYDTGTLIFFSFLPKRVRRLIKGKLMDDNIGQNTITITCKHITFSQLNVIIFKTLKKLKGKQLYIYFWPRFWP